jgi:hypothetical protein
MENEKNFNFDEDTLEESEPEFAGDKASRARNRTVMLTPEITGEVRARFAREGGSPAAKAAPGGSPEAREPVSRGEPPRYDTPLAPKVEPKSSPHEAVGAKARGEGVIWTKESPLVGFLVSYDRDQNGQVFDLRKGRLIVTSERAISGNFMMVEDETVSPMHAILRISAEGQIQVLDQLSEYGTRIKRFGSEGEEEELSGDKSSLEHGDTIMFGERSFHVCIIVRESFETDGY